MHEDEEKQPPEPVDETRRARHVAGQRLSSAALLGIYGLTAVAVLIFATPLVLIADGRERARNLWMAAAVAMLPLATLYALGSWRLASEPVPTSARARPSLTITLTFSVNRVGFVHATGTGAS